jgi:hypothetical protein
LMFFLNFIFELLVAFDAGATVMLLQGR